MSTAFLPPDMDEWCCVHCQRAGLRLHPPVLPDPSLPGGSAYLAGKAMLQAVTTDGVLDPRRLHDPDLARWQAAEARSARRPEIESWLDAAGATPPDHA